MKLPGFIDSHIHFLGLGYVNSNIDLTETKSIEEIKRVLTNYTNRSMIIGRGWNQEDTTEKRMLNKTDLNSVSRDIPIVMTRVCGHVLSVNDKMLEIADITEKTPQVVGGSFDFFTGIFSENAIALILEKLPKPTEEELEKYLIDSDEILLKNGITSVASDDFCIFDIPFEKVIDIIKRLYKENRIHVKITEQVNLPFNQLKTFIEKGYVNKKYGKYKMGPLKILADGSLGGKTAALNLPYENEPDNLGTRTYSDEELFKLIHLANSNEMDVVIHAIGDSAIDQVLENLIKSIELTKRYNHNHAIIHAQLATKSQIMLMKKYGIGAIVQPIFLNSDIQIIESRIGARSKESYLFKTMYDEGINIGFSTDSPIEPINPFHNIYSAISRKSIKHPNLEIFLPEESFCLTSSLKCYTENNLAYINEVSLPKGDFIVINKDLHAISLNDLLSVEVLETYIDNKLIYKKYAQKY